MSPAATKTPSKLVIGGPPRAELIPPEVAEGIKSKGLRRSLVALVIFTIILVLIGNAGALLLANNSRLALEEANARTDQLVAQQSEFNEVRQVSSMLEKTKVARQLGVLTEINWKSYFAEVLASLPAGTVITDFSAETATPTELFSEPSVPLQGERIGVLIFTATSPSLPDIKVWIDGLSGLTGFADASPDSVALAENGTYTVTITMHINSDAYSNRFAEGDETAGDEIAGDETTDDETTEEGDGN